MAEGQEIDLGTPGGSARREHERRRARREAKTRERHPRLGNLLLRTQSAPASETSWDTGAAGEEALAVHLAKTCPGVIVLHDRRMPNSRANIDHLAIAPSGVFVIDAKRYKGRIEIRKPFFGDPSLFIAGRNKTKLVEAGTPTGRGSLCTRRDDPRDAGARLLLLPQPRRTSRRQRPTLFKTLSINGFQLFPPRKLSKRLNSPGGGNDDGGVAKIAGHRVATMLARYTHSVGNS